MTFRRCVIYDGKLEYSVLGFPFDGLGTYDRIILDYRRRHSTGI